MYSDLMDNVQNRRTLNSNAMHAILPGIG